MVFTGAVIVLSLLVRATDGPSAHVPAPNAPSPTVPGLSKPVEVAFDGFDVPTIVAADENDAARALGFAHATDRFAQMDMMRRFAAGETAELLGPGAVDADIDRRNLRGREVARACVERLDARKRGILEAYVQGVNAGIGALPAPPMEHMLLGISPQPWKAEDCALVYLSMFHALARTGRADAIYAEAFERLPGPVLDFIGSPLSRLDCPVLPEASPPAMPPIPGADVIDLRSIDRALLEPPVKPAKDAAPGKDQGGGRKAKRPKPDDSGKPISLHGWTDALHGLWDERAAFAGSNGWVVAGSRTKDGRAILANDPHLMITAPILWYRCRMQWPGVDWTGLSIPGVPGIVIGGNAHVAVGFTNTTGDFEDIAIIDVDPADPGRYMLADGTSEPFTLEPQSIAVRGSKPVEFMRRMTRWGAVTGQLRCPDGVERPFVTLWVGARPDAINFEVLDMAHARSAREAVDLLARWYGPSQNAMIADRDGHVGWVVTGWIPDRRGHDPRRTWRPAIDGDPWRGAIDPAKRPMVLDPASGVIVTANHRTVPIEQCAVLGSYWAHPERAHRVHELLAEPVTLDERRMLDVQLDTELVGLRPYRDLALAVLDASGDGPMATTRTCIAGWNGRADADQPAVAVLSAFQRALERRFAAALIAWMRQQAGAPLPGLEIRAVHDEPWLRVLESRPPNWLPSGFKDWDGFIRAALEEALTKEPGSAPWGERNQARYASPVADALPAFLKPTFTLDDGPQPGHGRAVRVQTPRAAASARYIVSPGRESQGILQTPGGQSGDPKSPHYRSLHEEWRTGVATPLLPADPARRVTLVPSG